MLDFSVTKSTAMVAMQIVKILCKILAIKNYRRWAHTTTIVPIFIASCQCFDLASSYLIKKLVVNSEYSIQWIDKNSTLFSVKRKLVEIQCINRWSLWLRRSESTEGKKN